MVPVGVDRGLANSSKYESDGLFTEPMFATSYQPYLPPTGEAQHSATAFPTVPACRVSCNARGGLDIGEIAQRLVSSENFKVPFLLQNGVSWALHEPIVVMLLGVEYGWL